MRYARPVPAELADGRFYNERGQTFYLSPAKLEGDYAPVRFAREIRIFREFCPRSRVLDVGCSTGAFLHSLQARWPNDYAVLGNDVTEAALAHAESRGVPVRRGSLPDLDFEGQRFDAITFWAVLEHLVEPRRFLGKAADLLKSGGHCFVLVPNLGSLAIRMLGARYRYVMPDHVNYFSRATLASFVAMESRFELVTLRSMHFNPVVIWQDWRQTQDRVPDAERAELLRRTTAWKQNGSMALIRPVYSAVEWALGRMFLADNLVAVMRRR
jgi:2-polyprenyl-3-methyl-5-hydroxy-6-metoxy-1,4-benzoquinol methylase